jgi:hypothetical protein
MHRRLEMRDYRCTPRSRSAIGYGASSDSRAKQTKRGGRWDGYSRYQMSKITVIVQEQERVWGNRVRNSDDESSHSIIQQRRAGTNENCVKLVEFKNLRQRPNRLAFDSHVADHRHTSHPRPQLLYSSITIFFSLLHACSFLSPCCHSVQAHMDSFTQGCDFHFQNQAPSPIR